jgi:alpha-galactosidase
MGWNSWNTFATKVDEKLVDTVADAMVANGMRDAGYVNVNLDDGWSTKERDAAGNLVPDPRRFPRGMKALADDLHARGFKFGLYNCAGTKTCAGYPGGRDHEAQDAKLYASWGVDYLKYDWCNSDGLVAPVVYRKMHDALAAATATTGRPIVFSICEWGQSKPWTWAGDGTGQLWRTTGDIMASYDQKVTWSSGWKLILDQQPPLAPFAGPGHWNDPDMLEVGNGDMTVAEWRAHFSLWCVIAAPLIAGNDVRHMADPVREILTNREAIAVDQDALGKEGTRAIKEPGREVWAKQLGDGQWAVCVLNPRAERATLDLRWADELPGVAGKTYAVRDLWSHADRGDTSTPFHGELASHDVALFRLIPIR